MVRNKIIFCSILIGIFSLCSLPVLAVNDYNYSKITLPSIIGHTEDDFIEVYDESGKYIFGTCLGVSAGDRYISEDNNDYKIIKVQGKRATAKLVGKVDLLQGEKTKGTVTDLPPLAQGSKNKTIGLYCTHSDESYKPGPVSKPNGEIYNVASVIKEQFNNRGIKVIQSHDSFLPHDGGAYDRSRRTAAELLKQGTDAVFDIHRDAVPRATEYMTSLAGKDMSKVRIVVGRQNPNMAANDQLARRIKAAADKTYPGLVKGIFYARGKYNQDLSPKALLLEFGTHVTTKEEAEASTASVVDSIYTVLYGAGSNIGGGGSGTDAAQGRSSWTSLLWIVGIAVVVGLGFLFMNEGGMHGVKDRLKKFSGEEFANVLGRKERGKPKRRK